MEQIGDNQQRQATHGLTGQSAAASGHHFASAQNNHTNTIEQQASANYNHQTDAVERELLNYPMVLEHRQTQQQQLILNTQASHAENYEHHHQHEHGSFHSTENSNAQQQAHAYQTYPSVYETALEAAKPSYNILPYDTTNNSTASESQNNDAVNALIGEYFGQTTDSKVTQQDNGQAHDHSHAHSEHNLAEAPADICVARVAPVHGFHHVQQPETESQVINQLQQAWYQSQQRPEQNTAAARNQLASTGIQHPALPPMSKTLQQTAADPMSTTARDNIDAIRARSEMIVVLKDQTEAEYEVQRAEEELQRAKDKFEKAKANKASADEKVLKAADSLADGLLKENTRWNSMYFKLLEFKEKYGHCDVSRNPYRSSTKRMKRDKESNEQNELIALGTWVGQTRMDARRPHGHPDKLEPYKVVALNRIGFDWEPRENYWMEMYEKLKMHLEENNGKMPLRTIDGQKNPLGQWCETQVENYKQFQKGSKKAYITQEKIDMLNKIG